MRRTKRTNTSGISRRDFLATAVGYAGLGILTPKASYAAQDSRGRALEQQLAHDPHRPRYHFMPPAHWMNDPNGPIYWRGTYHLFYQYNPAAAVWGDMHWGHATSTDLIHWKHQPIALAPTPGSPDKDGCFSGSAFVHNRIPHLIYTGVSPETQCLASSADPHLRRWTKSKRNPVISAPPSGLRVTGFRDPSIWREDNDWLMSVGAGVRGEGGRVLLYTSRDLTNWSYSHTLAEGPPFITYKPKSGGKYDAVAAGDMWECPDFFQLGDRHVLLVSTQVAVAQMTGRYGGRKFEREQWGWVDDDLYYAAKSFVDGRNRRVLWGWIREGRSEAAYSAAGWAGVMSFPRVLTPGDGGTLRIEPAAEIAMLRGRHYHWGDLEVLSERVLPGVKGDGLEIEIEFEPDGAEELAVKVRRSPDGGEETIIVCQRPSRALVLDTRRSSQNPEDFHRLQTMPESFRFVKGGTEKLSIFLDCSVVETFANGRCCLTGRIYPSRADSLGVALSTKGGAVRVKSLDIFEMNPISPDRLTT
ncbi:MAG TPA: glycoside hydrolase family 32 protein [Terriglobia bacterium]|nr:glycoside hydrolase family 32 protein [Terriglobia bacterium]